MSDTKSSVVGGENAELGDVPFIVSLRIDNGMHVCGGVIISDKWVLTAAHCVSSCDIVSIQYGVVDICPSGNIDSVARILSKVVHEDYNAETKENDIALLKLRSCIHFGRYVKPAVLPDQDESVAGGTPALLAGWGRVRSGGELPTTLQKVVINIVDLEECRKAHAGNAVHCSNLCAGVPKGGKGQCNGDSGGPLICKGKVVGLVSWSEKPCCKEGYPGVFTRVASYRNWIYKKTRI